MTLTSRERVAAAMAKEVPDRIPVMCQLSIGHYFLQTRFDPIEIWYNSGTLIAAFLQLAERYRFDGILVNLLGRHPHWRDWIARIEPRGKERWIHWKNGGISNVPPDDNVHFFPHPNAPLFHPSLDEVDPERLWYCDPHDVCGVTYPVRWGLEDEPADPGSFFPDYLFESLRRARAVAGSRLSVHGEIFSPFSQFMEFFDLSNGLLYILDDPAKAHSILERFTRGAIELGSRQAACDIDALLISDAFAGAGFVSPAMYREFVMPYNRRVVEGVKAGRDLPIYVHTCGAIGDRLELIESCGFDGIDTLDPPPLGNVELSDALQRLGKRLFIKGNLDSVNTLLHGRKEDVVKAAKERIRLAGPGGAYILSTACSVAPHVAPENVAVLAEVVDECGVYPLE